MVSNALAVDDHQAVIVIDRLIASERVKLPQYTVVDCLARPARSQTLLKSLESARLARPIESLDYSVCIKKQGVAGSYDRLVELQLVLDPDSQWQCPLSQFADTAIGATEEREGVTRTDETQMPGIRFEHAAE